MANIEEKVEALVKDKIQELGYELYDVQYAKEGKDYYLRIFIDNGNGIDLNDCEKVSNGINDMLDKENYIKEQYFLEVSSPGIERVLRKNEHLEKQLGKEIYAKLFKPLNNKKEYIGILESYNDNEINLMIDEESINIDRKNIALMKTTYNWD